MTQSLSPAVHNSQGLLGRLRDVCSQRDLAKWAWHLEQLRSWMADDLAEIEMDIESAVKGPLAMHRCGRELLDLGGKRLRPLCVALAARMGVGFGDEARDLAVAVELMHSATLLHDDVVDFGETRRGAPTARVVYGNAAAIFGGDYLLVDALKRITRTELPGIMEFALETIEAMIEAEARQLEERGRICRDEDDYFRIVDGKTAALFRFALGAGAQAGGLPAIGRKALQDYGSHLGLAFQLVDDVLDYEGEQDELGKDPFADLREGRTTYPLMLALDRNRELADLLDQGLRGQVTASELYGSIREVLETTGALRDTRQRARREIDAALAALETLPSSRERNALVAVAEVSVQRRS